METDKQALRALMRERRLALARDAGPDFATRAARHFLAWIGARLVPAGSVVAAYWSIGAEADTRVLLEDLDRAGYRCALPVVVAPGTPLIFRRWMPGSILETGPLSTRQPSPDAETVDPRIVIVPLLAFDRTGCRLGQGGGYYDRTLNALRRGGSVTVIGFAYAGQEVESVPVTSRDQRLDGVLTENGVARFPERIS